MINKKHIIFSLLTVILFDCSKSGIDNSNNQISTENSLSFVYQEIAEKKYSYESAPINNLILENEPLEKKIMEPTLVFRFSESNCQECVKQVAKALSIHFTENNEKILVLGSYSSTRSLNLYLKSLNIDHLRWFNIPQDALNEQLDNQNIPYLFVANNQLIIDNLFIPHYSLESLTDKYIRVLSERLQ